MMRIVGGRGDSKPRASGWDLLEQQAVKRAGEVAKDKFDDLIDEIEHLYCIGDSPIERILFSALSLYADIEQCEFNSVIPVYDEALQHTDKLNSHASALLVVSQAKIGPHRVDFVVAAWTRGRVWISGRGGAATEGPPRYRLLVVECDGHDFHERTKEQAAADRSRDRYLQGEGYEVYRFTGSEIVRNPWKCAAAIHDWAIRGLA